LQTAGITIAHKLQFANIADFQGLGLDLMDPWAISECDRRFGEHSFWVSLSDPTD
jgi:hypothetical protein